MVERVLQPPAQARWALVVLMAAFGAREMDLHKAWTEKSVLKVSFYLENHPLHQKLVALAVLAAVIIGLGLLVRRHARSVWRGFRAGDTVCTTMLIFIVTMVVSKILDRSVNVLLVDYGIVTPAVTNALVGAIEEIVELSLPLIAGVGLAQHLTPAR